MRFSIKYLQSELNSFSISDELLLPADTFTFVSSSHGSTSWLDHVLSIASGHALVESVHVKTDFVSSDHLPLCFDISIDKRNYLYLYFSFQHK